MGTSAVGISGAFPPTFTRSSRVLQALSCLHERGLRATAARRIVLEILDAAPGPVSAGEVASGLGGRFPRLDLGSAYRVLDTLEQIEIARRVHLGGGPALFTLRSGQDAEYLLCESCGAARVVDPRLLDDVRRQIRLRFGLTPSFSSYPVAGVCEACALGPGSTAA